MRSEHEKLMLMTRYMQTFCNLVIVKKEDFLVVVSSRRLHAVTWKSCEDTMQKLLNGTEGTSFTTNAIDSAIENFRVRAGCPSFAEMEIKLAIAGVQIENEM